MNRWGYVGLLIILVSLGYMLYRHRQELGFASPAPAASQTVVANEPEPAPQPVKIEWQSVDRTMEGFKIEMPANAHLIKIPAYNEHGGSEQVDMLYAYPDPQICYSISWEQNPPVERINNRVPDRTLDMALVDALERSQTTLVSKSEISQQGFPGREFTAHNIGGGVFNSRLVLARHRLYMLTAAYPSADARRDEDVTHFFNSFSVVVPSRNN